VSKQGIQDPGQNQGGEAFEPGQGEDSVELQTPDAVAAALAECTAEKAELQDRILRSKAEFQNLRRRVDKEKLEYIEYASSEAVLALLPVLDDFERALKVESPDGEYTKGMQLIYQRFYDALKKLGLEPIDSVGKPFDPHVHHAVEKEESDQQAPDTVLAEYQRAYNFKGRLLRAAMVKVTVEPSSNN
jgi:molecular chaperone GrpE